MTDDFPIFAFGRETPGIYKIDVEPGEQRAGDMLIKGVVLTITKRNAKRQTTLFVSSDTALRLAAAIGVAR